MVGSARRTSVSTAAASTWLSCDQSRRGVKRLLKRYTTKREQFGCLGRSSRRSDGSPDQLAHKVPGVGALAGRAVGVFAFRPRRMWIPEGVQQELAPQSRPIDSQPRMARP